MCTKGNPSTTQSQSQSGTANTSANTSANASASSTGSIAPNPDTLALYQQFLNQAQGLSTTPYNPATQVQIAPFSPGQYDSTNALYNRGLQGISLNDARALTNAAAGPVSGNIAGLASSLASANPYAGAAVNYGLTQGQAIGDWGTSHGQAISNYATDLAARGPQLQQFSQGAIDQYMSPYIQDVVNTTQGQFNNQNSIQGNSLIGQAIRSGNAFGGDRAGVAQAQLAGQQQIAQAPVIAGLYNTGYNTALGEFNTQNALAAQLGGMAIQGQVAGGNMGLQGLTSGAQIGQAGYGQGLGAYQGALSTAASSLQSDANRQLAAGAQLGNLTNTEFGANMLGDQNAIAAANIYPAYQQNWNNQYAANQAAAAAYPFQTAGWYGNILGGLGPSTGSSTTGSNTGSNTGSSTGSQVSSSSGSGLVTPPQPSGWSQALGAVGTIAGLPFGPVGSTVGGTIGTGVGKLFGKDGGMVPRRAVGGGIDGSTPFSGAPYSTINFPGGAVKAINGYIPTLNMPRGNLLTPLANAAQAVAAPVTPSFLQLPKMDMTSSAGKTAAAPADSISGIADLLKNKGIQQGISGLGFGGNADSPMFKPGFMGTGSLYERGGFVGNLYDDDDDGNVRHYMGGIPEMDGGIIRPGSDRQHFAFGGLYDDDDTSDPTSTNVLGSSRQLYDSPAGPETPLAGLRKRFEPELQDPRVSKKLIGLTRAEVGNQGPEAQQALMETIFNRAASRGQTLDRTMATDYYPALGNFNRVPPAQQAAFRNEILPQVLSGSNVGNYATGNASGTVGFNGGPQVAAYGGERFGVEGPDRRAMADVAGGDISSLPPAVTALNQGSMPQGGFAPQSGLGGGSGQVIRAPAQERPQGDFLNRWLSNPMTQFGIAMLQSRSPYVSEAIGQGLAAASKTAHQSDLDNKPKLLTDGPELMWQMGDGSLIKTGLPSNAGLTDARQREANKTNEQYRRDVLQDRSENRAADRVAREDLEAKKAERSRLSGGDSATERLMDRLIKDAEKGGQVMSPTDAIAIIKRGGTGASQEELRRLGLAQSAAKNDPEGRPLEFWEQHYGAGKKAPAAPAAPVTPPQAAPPSPSGIPEAPKAPSAPKPPGIPEVRNMIQGGQMPVQDVYGAAREAVAKGKSQQDVTKRLIELGLNPALAFPQVPMSQ